MNVQLTARNENTRETREFPAWAIDVAIDLTGGLSGTVLAGSHTQCVALADELLQARSVADVLSDGEVRLERSSGGLLDLARALALELGDESLADHLALEDMERDERPMGGSERMVLHALASWVRQFSYVEVDD